MRGSPDSSGSYLTTQFSSIWRNSLISFMKLSWLFGAGLSGGFSSTTSSFFASLPPFLSSFLPPLPFLFSSFRLSYSSICFRVNLGAFRIACYSSVKASPRSFFISIKNFRRVFLARSARPGSASSHDFRVSFSLSSCRVSRTNAKESCPMTCATQQMRSVCSDLAVA